MKKDKEPEAEQKKIQNRINKFLNSGCKISIFQDELGQLLRPVLLDDFKIVRAYKIEGIVHFDISWRPIEIKSFGDFIVPECFYHHIVSYKDLKTHIILKDQWPDGSSQIITIEKIRLNEDLELYKKWLVFKNKLKENKTILTQPLFEIPWEPLVFG